MTSGTTGNPAFQSPVSLLGYAKARITWMRRDASASASLEGAKMDTSPVSWRMLTRQEVSRSMLFTLLPCGPITLPSISLGTATVANRGADAFSCVLGAASTRSATSSSFSLRSSPTQRAVSVVSTPHLLICTPGGRKCKAVRTWPPWTA